MAAEEDWQPAPVRFEELPVETRQFFASLTREDIGLVKSGMELAKWFRTTGRVGKLLIVTGFSLFGAMVALAQGWDYIVARFFTKGP